jgi:hypothetical protein
MFLGREATATMTVKLLLFISFYFVCPALDKRKFNSRAPKTDSKGFQQIARNAKTLRGSRQTFPS